MNMKYVSFNDKPYEIHKMVYDLIKPHSSILDLGCAAGYFARELQQKKCRVVGIDIDPDALQEAQKYCQKVVLANLNTLDRRKLPKQKFDYVLLLDLIEHLTNFNDLLALIKNNLDEDSKLILSTPNIAHVSIRLGLLTGNFNYTEYGILDKTHVHFFTFKTLIDTLVSDGYKIESVRTSSDFGQVPLIGRSLRHIPKQIQWQITRVMPTLFGVQCLVVAVKSRK